MRETISLVLWGLDPVFLSVGLFPISLLKRVQHIAKGNVHLNILLLYFAQHTCWCQRETIITAGLRCVQAKYFILCRMFK